MLVDGKLVLQNKYVVNWKLSVISFVNDLNADNPTFKNNSIRLPAILRCGRSRGGRNEQ